MFTKVRTPPLQKRGVEEDKRVLHSAYLPRSLILSFAVPSSPNQENDEPLLYLRDMQCCWFATERGSGHLAKGDYPNALKDVRARVSFSRPTLLRCMHSLTVTRAFIPRSFTPWPHSTTITWKTKWTFTRTTFESAPCAAISSTSCEPHPECHFVVHFLPF
jgi:hypothetical protein